MIYLDNAAIERPKQVVIDVVMDILKNTWGNASSIYDFGLKSARIVQNTKNIIANEINCDPDEIIFTSCGSESNALATDGFLHKNPEYGNQFICSTIEHSSLLNNPKAKPIIFCDEFGFFKENWIKEIHNSLVSIQFANSEIGSIQYRLKEHIKILHNNNCIVHTDAVAAFGKFPIDVKDLDIDMLTATGQKIGGIYGAAFLYVKKGIHLSPIIYGTQNDGLRGGTYNIPAIAAMGEAVCLMDHEHIEIKKKTDYLLNELCKIHGVHLNGSLKNRLCNNINVYIDDITLDSQQLVSVLDMYGYQVSAGSACHSYSKEPSHVLKAIGLSDEQANKSIRITLSEDTTWNEIDIFLYDFKNIIDQFRG